MKIPLCKPSIDSKEIKIVSKLLKTQWLSHGAYNNKFEEKFNKLFKTKYSISMNSCTSALECAIKSLGLRGEVIIPSFTWVSTANAVINSGCKPVFADINFETRNIDPKSIEKNINKNTSGIIVVHFAGLPCDMDNILNLCKKYKLSLIEDSAETLGAKFKDKYTGTFGTGCFSFFPTKNITTTEGGMMTTDKIKIYHKAKKIIAHGIDKNKKKNFWNREAILPGHNYRMPNHLAALGLSQLKKLQSFNKKRQKIAKLYSEKLDFLAPHIKTPKIPKECTHSFQMYTITIKKFLRNKLLYYLKSKEIEASAHFDPPLHKQKYLKKYIRNDLENTNKLSDEILTLPIYPSMKKKETMYVINNIYKFFKFKEI